MKKLLLATVSGLALLGAGQVYASSETAQSGGASDAQAPWTQLAQGAGGDGAGAGAGGAGDASGAAGAGGSAGGPGAGNGAGAGAAGGAAGTTGTGAADTGAAGAGAAGAGAAGTGAAGTATGQAGTGADTQGTGTAGTGAAATGTAAMDQEYRSFERDRQAFTGSVANNMSADELIGSNIVGPGGENVATVNDLLIDQEGNIQLVIADVGGFLGMGARTVAIQLDQLQPGPDGQQLATSMTEEDLRALPEFEQTDGMWRQRAAR